jgi:polyferredoxin
MDKLGRDRGLIRYASTSSLAGNPTRWIRPRTIGYGILFLIGSIVALVAFRRHEDYEANLLRLPGPPYVVQDGDVRDAFELHLVNKANDAHTFEIDVEPAANLVFVVPMRTVLVEPMHDAHVPIFATMSESKYEHDCPIAIRIRVGKEERTVTGTFLGRRP